MNWNLDRDNGWQEAVIVVSDLDKIADDLMIVGGWEVASTGNVEKDQIKAMGLSDDVTAKYKLIKNPNEIKGLIRLVKIENCKQEQIRPAGQIWEAGGIFDLNLRVTNINEKFKQLSARGWHAYNEPIEYSFGPVVVSEVLMLGPDGVSLALIERIAPPLENAEKTDLIGRCFNSSLIVENIQKSFEFYSDVLGFKTAMEVLGHSLPRGGNVLGLPHNIVSNHAMNVYIVHPEGVKDGSIELLELNNLEGRNFKDKAKPYNLGITSLRFPVSDIDKKADHIKSKGIPLTVEPTTTYLAPYGEVKTFAFEIPDGGWFEYFECQK